MIQLECVRNLESLGLDNNNYRPMLLPILIHKLPEEIGIKISEEFNDADMWDITKVLGLLQT